MSDKETPQRETNPYVTKEVEEAILNATPNIALITKDEAEVRLIKEERYDAEVNYALAMAVELDKAFRKEFIDHLKHYQYGGGKWISQKMIKRIVTRPELFVIPEFTIYGPDSGREFMETQADEVTFFTPREESVFLNYNLPKVLRFWWWKGRDEERAKKRKKPHVPEVRFLKRANIEWGTFYTQVHGKSIIPVAQFFFDRYVDDSGFNLDYERLNIDLSHSQELYYLWSIFDLHDQPKKGANLKYREHDNKTGGEGKNKRVRV